MSAVLARLDLWSLYEFTPDPEASKLVKEAREFEPHLHGVDGWEFEHQMRWAIAEVASDCLSVIAQQKKCGHSKVELRSRLDYWYAKTGVR